VDRPVLRARSDRVKRLRLGTRGSALALAQSRLIANALGCVHPELQVDLVAQLTRGDRDQRIPLSTVTDANFFSAELDAALLNHDVDFCVHSIKDLGNERPDGIVCAAIPARENPRDVIVFRRDVIERIRKGQPVRIGSSSTRRRINVEAFLVDALPQFTKKSGLQFSPLRGPVDERLTRIQGAADESDALDGVVLALAGLNRLWHDPAGRKAVAPLLTEVRWMVLPPSVCPAAPGQGALTLECRHDDTTTRNLLASLHDTDTATLVRRELDFVRGLPANSSAGVGVTALSPNALGPIVFVHGPHANTNGAIWDRPPKPVHARAWDGGKAFFSGRHQPLSPKVRIPASDAVFVAHWNAVTESVSINSAARIWVSGIKSWRHLAARGLWVEGCADNLGFSNIVSTLASEVLDLPPLNDWSVLTHRDAVTTWAGTGVGPVIATYVTIPPKDVASLRESVREATHFFWGSADQYRAIGAWVAADAHHACGAGKTGNALRELGIQALQVFPSREEWQTWLR
jgi:hydroxymethylbilane synthase